MNVKSLLAKTKSIISALDPYLIKILHLIQNKSYNSDSFIEFNDFCFNSDMLLKYLRSLKKALIRATENAENQISRLRKKRNDLEYKYTLYKKLEILLKKTSNPTKIRYAMYTVYGETWEDFLEISTLEILDEMDYGKSVSSTLYRNVEQILDSFTSESSPIFEIDKNISFYSILKDGIPQYTEDIDNRIKIICYLTKIVA